MSNSVNQWRNKVNAASDRVGNMRAALVAIQELHKQVWVPKPFPGGYICELCDIPLGEDPCLTWVLADDALGNTGEI